MTREGFREKRDLWPLKIRQKEKKKLDGVDTTDRTGDVIFQSQEVEMWYDKNFCAVRGIGDRSVCEISLGAEILDFGTFPWFIEPKRDFGESILKARTEWGFSEKDHGGRVGDI